MKFFSSTTKMFTLAMVAIMAFAFSSCEDHYYYDEYDYGWYGDRYRDKYTPSSDYDYLIRLAQTMRGKWEGSLKITAPDEISGKMVETYYTTVFEFDQYSYNTINGRGVEIDYLDGEEDYYDTFSWYIDEKSNPNGKTKDIMLQFDSNGRTMRMDSYHVDADRFYGSMFNAKTNEYNDFDLTRYTYADGSGNLFEGDNAAPAQKTETKHATGQGGHK